VFSFFLSIGVSPAELKLWAETIGIYLAAISAVCTVILSAFVTGATVLLRFLNFFVPIVEEWYPRTGPGEWRPKFWSIVDKTTWTIQRVSGAGHLPSQTELQNPALSIPISSVSDWRGASVYREKDGVYTLLPEYGAIKPVPLTEEKDSNA
jgi:hypothetical protein